MQGTFSKAIVIGLSLCLATAVNARTHTMHTMHKWVCETNASSATTAADKKADSIMTKKAMSAKDAFAFAYKHCRDCTKISCSGEENNSNTQNSNSMTNQ